MAEPEEMGFVHDFPSSAEQEKVVAALDARACKVLTSWGPLPKPSAEALAQLHQLHSMGEGIPSQLLKDCQRLRLVALTVKVVSLLMSPRGVPEEATLSKVRSWARAVHSAVDVAGYEGVWAWQRGLRTLCDVLSVGTPATGLHGIDMIVHAQPSVNTSDAVIEVLDAIGRINTVLPQQLPVLGQQDKAEGIALPTTVEAQFEDILEDSERASQKRLQGHGLRADARCHDLRGTRKQQQRQCRLEAPYVDKRVRPEPGGDGPSFVPEAHPTVKGTPGALSVVVGLRSVPGSVAAGSSSPAVLSVTAKRKNAASSLFDAPLAGFDDAALWCKHVRSAAPAVAGPTSASHCDVPTARRGYLGWTRAEEKLLKEGYACYGRKWELIRGSCGLRHRLGTQLREKWRNLVLAGDIQL